MRGADADGTLFDASAMLLKGANLLKGGMGIGERGRQVRRERWLMVFDDENGFPTACVHTQHEILLGMQRICRTDSSLEWQTRQERLCYGNLIGLLGNDHLEEGFLTVMGAEGEQMRRGLLVGCRTTNCFAIQSNGVIGFGLQSGAYPVSQRPFDLLSVQAGEQLAGEGITVTEKATWPEQLGEEMALVTTPFSNGQGRVTVAEQSGDQAHQQEGGIRSAVSVWNEDLECWQTLRTN